MQDGIKAEAETPGVARVEYGGTVVRVNRSGEREVRHGSPRLSQADLDRLFALAARAVDAPAWQAAETESQVTSIAKSPPDGTYET